MVTISQIKGLPSTPFEGSGIVGINIREGYRNYFKLAGSNLNNIVNFTWIPLRPGTLKFITSPIVLADNQTGTFSVTITDNMLDTTDRAGKLIFQLADKTTIPFQVKTYGNLGRLWIPPQQGLITGN